MTNTYSTQGSPATTKLFPKTPKQPLYLSIKEIKACIDIDLNGVAKAKKASLVRIESLANCLATEVINFNSQWPDTPAAGLLLNVEVVLPVAEDIEQWGCLDGESGK